MCIIINIFYLNFFLHQVDLFFFVLEFLLKFLVQVSKGRRLTLAVQVPLFQGRDSLLLKRKKMDRFTNETHFVKNESFPSHLTNEIHFAMLFNKMKMFLNLD